MNEGHEGTYSIDWISVRAAWHAACRHRHRATVTMRRAAAAQRCKARMLLGNAEVLRGARVVTQTQCLPNTSKQTYTPNRGCMTYALTCTRACIARRRAALLSVVGMTPVASVDQLSTLSDGEWTASLDAIIAGGTVLANA